MLRGLGTGAVGVVLSIRLSFGNRLGSVEQWHFQSVDLLQRFSSDSLKVTIHAGGRLDDSSYLFFTLGPKARHCFPFPVEVCLHVGKFFEDCFDAMSKPRAHQVLIDHLHLGLLPLTSLASGG